MATPKSQRIAILVIAIVLTIGTLGSFLVMGLAQTNQKIDNAELQKQYDELMKQQLKEQKASAQLNADSSEPLNGYAARAFDAASVTDLRVETLVPGNGQMLSATDSINASYFGWFSDGKIFDSSKKVGLDDTPIVFALDGVVAGWTEGLTGIKVGSVVRLTIPSEKAYKGEWYGIIPPNSPLEFIVEIHNIDNSQAA